MIKIVELRLNSMLVIYLGKLLEVLKPNIFEVYRDDSLLDQSANVLDQQKWLEQNVIKMNFKSLLKL